MSAAPEMILWLSGWFVSCWIHFRDRATFVLPPPRMGYILDFIALLLCWPGYLLVRWADDDQ